MEERIKNVTTEVNNELLQLFGDKIERIILYGSYARGDYTVESDVDFIILLNCDQKEIAQRRKEISKVASRVGLKNDVMVSLIAHSRKEFDNNIEYQPFYQNIKKDGVRIYG